MDEEIDDKRARLPELIRTPADPGRLPSKSEAPKRSDSHGPRPSIRGLISLIAEAIAREIEDDK